MKTLLLIILFTSTAFTQIDRRVEASARAFIDVSASDFVGVDSLHIMDIPARTMITKMIIVVDTAFHADVDSIKIGISGDDNLRWGRYFNQSVSAMAAGYSKLIEARNTRYPVGAGLTTYEREITITCTDADTWYQVHALNGYYRNAMDTIPNGSSLRVRPYQDGLYYLNISGSISADHTGEIHLEMRKGATPAGAFRTASMSRTVSASGALGNMASFGPADVGSETLSVNDTLSLWVKYSFANTDLTIDHASITFRKNNADDYYYTGAAKKLMIYTNGLNVTGRMKILIEYEVMP